MKKEFLSALKQENKSHLPVWFMRQAGRYLPEYMELKKHSSFREMSHTPELIKEVTLQPLRRFPLDAAILFSDILTCLEFMGSTFEFTDHGPKLKDHGAHVVKKLKELTPEKDLNFVGEGLKLIKNSLQDQALIGFAGAPFTLISYLVEGGTSKDFLETKRFMMSEPESFSLAMNHLSTQIANYLIFQIQSGADCVQIFDSWVGILSYEQYKRHILPHMQNLIQKIHERTSAPVILYSQPTTHLVELLAETGADCLSVDWRLNIYEISKKIPQNISLQGNLDPLATTLNWKEAAPYVEDVLIQARRAEILDRFIFNVGHGVTPQTKPDTLAAIVGAVHSYK